jgi:hypothetical protein
MKKARTLLLIIGLLALAGCKEAAKSKPEEIRRLEVGGREFYIPRGYFSASYTGAAPNSILIQAWYPGDRIIPGKPNDLWRKGTWSKNVRILIQRHPNPNLEKVLRGTIDQVTHATQLVGSEYGLTHWTQPPEGIADNWDLWVEKSGDKPLSFITCADKASVPQCAHRVDVLPFSLQIHYDMKLLPEWKKIEKHVLSLYDSFKTPETATEYFKESYNDEIDKEIVDDHVEHHQSE